MKRFLLFLLFASPLAAQISNPGVQNVTTTPTSCPPLPLYYLAASNELFGWTGTGTTCQQVNSGGSSSGVSSFNTRTGAVTLTAADVNGVGAITNATSGNATTASALAATPSTCTTGQAPTGVLANGNATGCAAISAGFPINYVAAKCQSGAAGLAFSSPLGSSPTPVCDPDAVNGVIFGVAEFTATGQSVQDHFSIPAAWTGTIAINGSFRNAATSGNVVWDIQTACVATSSILDPTFNSANQMSVASMTTTLQRNVFSNSSITVTGCSAGNELFWKFSLDASTTTTGNIDLVGVTFTLSGVV